ncbi:MAG: hypothetical protein KGZ93_00745, partial [Actinobacteria bacterium]|nr:hypothetical protein [Actinomycetota bacterium]
MSKSLIFFTLLLLIVITGYAIASNNQNKQLSSVTIKELQAQLGDYLKKDTDLRHWKLLDTKISLVSQESSGAEVSAVFHTEREYRLNYAKADDAPALKGRSAFMKNNAKKLSQKQLEAANKDIEIWRQELNQCINTDQTG